MAKFSKVSFEQFEKDYKAIFGDEITDEQIHEMYDNIKLPKRATAGSAGYDFFAPFTMQIRSYNELLIPTGIRAKLDDGTFLAIVPRSGLGFKHYFRLANEIGIIDADYYNGYDYHIYYITNNKKTEISSVEQGAILVFFNGNYADWYDENLDQVYKNNCLKQIYDNAIIEITVKNSDRNRYFTKKKFKNEEEFVNNNAPMVISDIIVSDKLLVDRDNYGNVGFITLKYLKHKFKDNYVSVPKSIDWIKIKNGLENEYTSYGSDAGVSVKNQSKKYITDNKLDSKKIDTFIKAAKSSGDYFVINSETEELVENPKFTYETTSKGIQVIKTIKNGNTDITNKAKVYHKQKI